MKENKDFKLESIILRTYAKCAPPGNHTFEQSIDLTPSQTPLFANT